MPIFRQIRGFSQNLLAAEGLMYQDWDAISPCQRRCTTRLGIAIQREQELYLTKHPEILAMLKIFIASMTLKQNWKDFEKDSALYFTRPASVLDEEIRTFLELPEDGPYIDIENRDLHEIDDEDFLSDLKDIIISFHPPLPWEIPPSPISIPNTVSSSFISDQTSEITLPTPEPVPTPELTISEIFYNLISNIVDKVIYIHVNEDAILYDTAYVELMKAVEQAMEIPVIDIRADIAELFNTAYFYFETQIKAKERYAAEIAWEKRMRKKLKRTLRRLNNFKGYETPPSKSTLSSHESYKKPMPRPCECNPVQQFNRYDKDRFGIYLPRKQEFRKGNITTTPVCSLELDEDKTDTKSVVSRKSTQTTQSVSASTKSSAKPDRGNLPP